MAEIGSWNGHSFVVSPTLIRGFTGLTIKGSSETEDKTSNSQKYVSRKNSKPSEITLTVEPNAMTGCDVKNEALKFVDEARCGANNYFYLSGKKLISCKLMLTEASISETVIAPNGTWVSCKVKLTMKQCAKYDGTSSGSSSGSSSSSGGSSGSSSSSKKTSTKTSATKTMVSKAVAFVKSTQAAAKSASTAASSAKAKITKVVNAVNKAKATSALSKVKSAVKKVVSGKTKVTVKKK